MGYLGTGEDLKEALASRGLMLTGGYIEIDVSDEEAGTQGFAELEMGVTSSKPYQLVLTPYCSRALRSPWLRGRAAAGGRTRHPGY